MTPKITAYEAVQLFRSSLREMTIEERRDAFKLVQDLATVTEAEHVTQTLREMQGSRTLSAFAKDVNVSATYISEVYNGKPAGPKIYSILGIEQKPNKRWR